MQDQRKRARAQWALVACLTLLNMLAQIDKNILVLMVGPIQRDFGVSDIQISFLIGTAFAVANILVGLPAGWLADRFDRRLVIATGVLVWSAAVAANAAATAFIALVIARAVVGAAEALTPPSSYSLIRDGVDERRRARALSVYTMSMMLGTGLSLVLGGPLLHLVQASGIHALPFVGEVSAWQLTLFMIGVAGLPLSLLIFCFKDPRSQRDAAARPQESLRTVLRWLAGQRRLFVPLFTFAVGSSMIGFGMAAWIPTMIARRWGLELRDIGLMQGGLLLTMGPLGLWLVGVALDRATGLAAVARIGAVVAAATTLFSVSMCLTGDLTAFWLLDALVVLCSWSFMAVASTFVARTVPAGGIGMVMAIVLVLNGLIAQSGSPTLIALVARHLYDGQALALPSAMATVFALSGCIAVGAALLLGGRLARRETSGAVLERRMSS